MIDKPQRHCHLPCGNRLNLFLVKVSKSFWSENIDVAYFRYLKFSNFQCQDDASTNDYITDFENW